MQRFRDEHQSIYSFVNHFLVRCPECDRCATVRPHPSENTWRLVCGHCATVQKLSERQLPSKSSAFIVDPYFHYPLWLQASCCSKQLWAFNPEHLDFLAAFVQATHRENRPHETYGWKNNSLASRLPKWIQSAKNRDAILKTIMQLQQTLPDNQTMK